MLIENKKSYEGQVIVIKLATGEEVIARCTSGSPLTITNPLAMVMMPNEEGDQGVVAFAPWVLGLEDDQPIEVKENHIVVLTKARSDAADQYVRAIGEDAVETAPSAKVAPQILTSARKGGRGR